MSHLPAKIGNLHVDSIDRRSVSFDFRSLRVQCVLCGRDLPLEILSARIGLLKLAGDAGNLLGELGAQESDRAKRRTDFRQLRATA